MSNNFFISKKMQGLYGDWNKMSIQSIFKYWVDEEICKLWYKGQVMIQECRDAYNNGNFRLAIKKAKMIAKLEDEMFYGNSCEWNMIVLFLQTELKDLENLSSEEVLAI